MPFSLGLKVLKRLCAEQSPLGWQKAKLSTVLFKPYELPMFEWVMQHLKTHHTLPHPDTLIAQFPDFAVMETPEPSSYYVQLLENQFFYDTINKANLDAQAILKADQNSHEDALESLRGCIRKITEQKYRVRILDVGKDSPSLVIQAYYKLYTVENVGMFGWPYLDTQSGGVMPGDVISIVGRPSLGKTWLTLWTALHNWTARKMNVLFVSMEMMTLPIAQRITSLYTKQNIQQLKMGGFSSSTMKKFQDGLKAMVQEQAKFYVVDGNLAASVEDIFALAEMLSCYVIVIDGAYLLRHRNFKLDRFTRAAENVELIKRQCTDTNRLAFCSWQFNRQATEKQKKGKEQGGLEDIGYSDAIGQISSIALALFQEDTVETIKTRKIQVMKGRNGETGQFQIAWDFLEMNFAQNYPVLLTDAPETQYVEQEPEQLEWV